MSRRADILHDIQTLIVIFTYGFFHLHLFIEHAVGGSNSGLCLS